MRATTAANNIAYSIVSSDASIRSELDASFDSKARFHRDSSNNDDDSDCNDNDSLSYSDDSTGPGGDNYGWYTNGEGDEKKTGEEENGIFF